MKILIAGGTGFVGASLTGELIKNGHQVSLLVREKSGYKVRQFNKVSVVRCEYDYPVISLDDEFEVLANCVGIIREFPSKEITFEKAHYEIVKYLIDLARANSIKRFIQISALGVGPDAKTGYFKTKYRAEEAVRNSGLNYTIFRPSTIFGPNDDFINMLLGMFKRLPVMPVIGDGKYHMQPVYIDDLCSVIIKSLEDELTFYRSFEIGGPEIISYNSMLDTIGNVLGKRVPKIHQPVVIMRILARMLGRFSWFPITTEQLTMLLEDNFTHDKSLFEQYNIHPRSFEDGLRDYL